MRLYAGLLATIDMRSDPVAVYRALAELDPPNLDFLLPHGTWDAPPPGKRARSDGRLPVRLAASPARRRTLTGCPRSSPNGQGRPARAGADLRVHHRDHAGRQPRTESLGLAPSDVVVIETDGTIEQADSIKVAYDGAPATGLDVFSHPLDAAAAHPGIRARQQGIAGLSPVCRQCPVVDSCGGGLYAHRYRTGSGFANPSVYCADLEKIITHVRARLRPEAAEPQTSRGQPVRGAAPPARAAARPISTPWPPGSAMPSRSPTSARRSAACAARCSAWCTSG